MKIVVDKNAREFILAKANSAKVYVEIRRVSGG